MTIPDLRQNRLRPQLWGTGGCGERNYPHKGTLHLTLAFKCSRIGRSADSCRYSQLPQIPRVPPQARCTGPTISANTSQFSIPLLPDVSVCLRFLFLLMSSLKTYSSEVGGPGGALSAASGKCSCQRGIGPCKLLLFIPETCLLTAPR